MKNKHKLLSKTLDDFRVVKFINGHYAIAVTNKLYLSLSNAEYTGYISDAVFEEFCTTKSIDDMKPIVKEIIAFFKKQDGYIVEKRYSLEEFIKE